MTAFREFIGGSYPSQSWTADQELTMNWYPELMEVQGATSRQTLFPIPGVTAFAMPTASGNRGLFMDDTSGRCFAVNGASFVEILSDGSTVVRGTVAVNGNPATISTNGAGGGQLLLTSGDKAYSYTLSTDTLTEELSSGATMGAVLYGYGLVFDIATGKVKLSNLYDLTTWDPTQFFQRSIGTDPWMAMHVTPYGYIVLPGSRTGETWYNSGAFPIPFQPDPSGQFSPGIAATFSIAQVDTAVMWLSKGIEGDFQVVRQSGFTPQRVSTHAVEWAIAGYNDTQHINDAIAMVYGEHGHLFYNLTFPTAKATWTYDASMGGNANPWHQRGTWIVEDNQYTYWRPTFHAFAFGGIHLVGDPEGNTIYTLEHQSTADVDGRVIRRLRRSPAVISEHRRVIIDQLEILFQSGVGTQTGQGQNPQATLRVSRDGGQTWGNERSVSIGKAGQYWARALFRMLGMGRLFVFELVCTDPVPWRVIDAYLKIRPSAEAAA